MAKSPFQFSIRLMLAFVAAVGISLRAIMGEPGMVSSMLMLFMLTVIPATALVGIIHSGGYLRAFFIGLLVPSSLGLAKVWHILVLAGAYGQQWYIADSSMYRVQATLIWSLALATGVSCAAFRWLLDKES